MKRILATALAFLVLGGALFAQPKVALNIQCNISGAAVLINGKPSGYCTPVFTVQIPPGTYKITVTKPNYVDFNSTLNIPPAGLTIQVNLQSIAAISTPPPTQFQLSVNANVPGADVFINGNNVGHAPFASTVPAGSYQVAVRAPGYLDFSQNLVVNGPASVNAILSPMSFQLSVNANVQGAEVLINGNSVGRTPFAAPVPGGSYQVTVRAPGYADFSQNLVVSGQASVNALLTALSFQLSVNANVQNAEVLVNGNSVGRVPFMAPLPGGSYQVTVRAPGYLDFNQSLVVSGPSQVNALLVAQPSTWRINIPDAYYYKDKDNNKDKEKERQRSEQLSIFIDGNQQRALTGQVPTGRHVFRIVVGPLVFETSIDVQVGKTYTIEPFIGFNVK